MLVEYSFVTTLEAEQAMRLASDFLVNRGFAAESSGGFALDHESWTTLEMRRYKKSGSARTNTAVDLPQIVHLEWDRGRITMAVLSPHTPVFNMVIIQKYGGSPMERDQRRLLYAITRSMELLLAEHQPEQAADEWDRAEQAITAPAAEKRKGNRALTIVFVILATGQLLQVEFDYDGMTCWAGVVFSRGQHGGRLAIWRERA